MKHLIGIVTAFITVGCTDKPEENAMRTQNHQEHRHGASVSQPRGHASRHDPERGAELVVATEPADPVAGRAVTLRLMIHRADGMMVRDFDVTHGEKVHLVIVRDGLDHFAHIHPTVDGEGNLTVTHTFPAGGTYRLFADYTPAGGEHATATGALPVGGESPPAPAATPDAPGAVRGDGLRAAISAAPLKAGFPARVTFDLRDGEGIATKLEPYLGELGHLMFVGVGTWQYVHVHPAGGDAARGKVEFLAHFAEPGLYKGWGQFKQGGRVRVVPLVLRVD